MPLLCPLLQLWLLLNAALMDSKFCVAVRESRLFCLKCPFRLPFSSTFSFCQFMLMPVFCSSVMPSPAVLAAFPTRLTFWSPRKALTFVLAWYRACVPPPAEMFPKVPRFLSFFTERSSTVFSLPSSIPVIRAWSLFFSYALIFSMVSAGMFLSTSSRLLPKNSLPSTSIWLISFPFHLIVPSSSISTPGSFFTSSSTIAPSSTAKASAL